MNNLLIELKRSQLKDEFNALRERMNNSPQQTDSSSGNAISNHFERRIGLDKVEDINIQKDLELQDTEDPEIKQGIKSNGVKYSVRTNRKRFFFPDEWMKFKKSFETDSQKRSYDILINTGARINEIRHIKKQDIDFDRGTLTIKVAKIKAKKGEKFPDPRTFKLSTQFLARMKGYVKNLNDNDYIPILTDSALNIAMKKLLKRIGIKDYKMFSVHNIRKTHGNWLVAHNFHMANICGRLGHSADVYLKSYGSADIFNDKDRELIGEILGDLINNNGGVKNERSSN